MPNGAKCDFNDLYLEKGLDAVTAQVAGNLQSPLSQESDIAVSDGGSVPGELQQATGDVVPLDAKAARPKSRYSDRFKVNISGVYFKDDDDDWQFICSPLDITAITRDQNGQSFGRLLEWTDVDGIKHHWAMPMSMLAGDGLELRKELLHGGLSHIGSGANPSYTNPYKATTA